ncbi:glycosyl transferase family 1 [Kineosporia sp. NBRC 101677]|uniref:glycosyltransferase n=1 Tax=Kineosporia sp. NBRC 101677 TaxID=3032197 RepID=UPI0024A392DD|nr:glycosyltransferase [Kineosporia sp. NBRC 101677]GLY15752.1 glycosyl transferase family 1 [Kineosporia sp. NBRC 101677]
MTLKVLRVAASVSPSDGGPSLGTLALSRELRGLGVEDVIVSTDAHDDGHLHVDQIGHAESLDLTLTRVHSPKALKASLGMLPTLIRRLQGTDVVHIHGFYLFHTAAAAILARIHRVPYLIQPHGVFEPYQEKQSAHRKSLYNRLVGSYILRNAAGMLFATESERDHAHQILDRYRTPAFLMSLGSAPPGDPAHAQVAVAKNENNCNILFLARIAPKKRVDLVIGAFPLVLRRYPAAQLTIAGSGDTSLLHDALKQLTAGERSRVNVVGFVEGAAKAHEFSRADVYVLPSENENFGISVAEALHAGLPAVVTADVAIAPQIAEWGAGVVLSGRSIETVADGILQALAPTARETMSKNAKRLAEDRFSWASSARQALSVYQDVLAAAERRAVPQEKP